jgi:hypothetical protein
MAGGGLPPPPTRAGAGDFAWTAWYNQLYTLLNTQGSVSWDLVNKAGSSIADLQNKNHNLLTAIQGGTTNEYYHLTAAQYATIASTDTKYGAFHSSSTQTAAAANTAYAMSFSATDYSNGVTLVSGTQLKASTAGLYNVQFSAQIASTDASIHDIDIWFRKNGTDIADSNSMLNVPAKHGSISGRLLPAWNIFIQLSANDYVEIMWNTTSTNVSLEATGTQTSPTRPATPSVIATMDRVHA